jgi:hypothetical protein
MEKNLKKKSLQSKTLSKSELISKKSIEPAKNPVEIKKDYNNKFKLLLIPELEDLDLKIESKQRIIDSIGSKDWKIVPIATQNYIKKLNNIYENLKTQLLKIKKERSEDTDQSDLKTLAEDLTTQTKSKETLDKDLESLIETIKSLNSSWNIERNKLEKNEQEVIEEQESLKTDIILKDMELSSIKNSIRQVSDKLNNIKEMNRLFNQNIEKINNDIENANKRYYEAKIIDENCQETRTRIRDTIDEYIKNEKEIFKVNRKISMVSEFFDKKESRLELLEDIQGKISKALEIIPNYQNENFANELETLIKSLEAPVSHLLPLPFEDTPENSDYIRKIIISNSIMLKKIEIKNFQEKNPIKEAQIGELKQRIQSGNEIGQEKTNFFQKQSEYFQKQYDIINKKLEDINKESIKKQEMLLKSKQKLEENIKKNTEVHLEDNLTTNLRKDSLNIPSEPLNSHKSDQEKKLSKVLIQLDILKQEVNTKDIEIIKNLREKQKSEIKQQHLKLQQQKISSRIKTLEADLLKAINVDLENKDKQIIVLKEMLRGSQGELKIKEQVIDTYRSKLNDLLYK